MRRSISGEDGRETALTMASVKGRSMSKARRIFDTQIERLRKSADGAGGSLEGLLLALYPYEETAEQSPPKGLAAIFEHAAIERARPLFYEWLANQLLDAPRGTQKQRQAGVRRGLQKQLEAARRKEKIFWCAAELLKRDPRQRALNKTVTRQLDEKLGYVRKTLAGIKEK